jgi:hypothetical protein
MESQPEAHSDGSGLDGWALMHARPLPDGPLARQQRRVRRGRHEAAAIRDLIRTHLTLPGFPQMLLQSGAARTTWATARPSPADLIEPR